MRTARVLIVAGSNDLDTFGLLNVSPAHYGIAQVDVDGAMHKAILLATHNVVIQQLSDAVSALQRAIFDYTFISEARHMNLTMKEHSDLFDAIRRKNPEAAEQACHDMVGRTAGRARIRPAALAMAAVSPVK